MKTCGLLVIHGIGTSQKDYDVPFHDALTKRLRKAGKDPEKIAYQKVFWAEYLNTRQNHYHDLCRTNPLQKMGWDWLRKIVIDRLADASAYQRQHGAENNNYFNILREIHTAMVDIRDQLGSDDKPLIIVAHSLGGFIISNYIWDVHKMHDGEDLGWPADIIPTGNFAHMVNLSGMITFGCNIPLFVLGHDPIVAIRFPHPELPATLKAKAEWHNYYDPKDVLGWPLTQLEYSYEGLTPPAGTYTYPQIVTKDEPIRILGINPASWSALSHVFYWTHRNFLSRVVDFVGRFL